ncbi:MAG: SAM-dependent methyltransferase [Elusimicrobia bacterium HGW-Elusimicrobia-1]|nr:MAG: SAM-dependent methyltransferase [Elusimicrobia bacterium HGW-Elusimicrobia-1]
MKKCRSCETPIEPFMSFGKMPIANGFLTEEQFAAEYFFEMKVASCPKCGLFQLTEQPEREKMFNENYAFFSGTSKLMAVHFKEFADDIKKKYLGNDPFVVEIGSNDGIMLKNFAESKIRHLGIEPSANVADVARASGVNTVSEFFDKDLAEKIVAQYGRANAFLGANVMCHIPYIHSVVDGIKTLLAPDGVVAFEDPYLGDVIEKTTYDQIYDEHVFLYSVNSVKYLFESHGMEVIDALPQETHGGSMRYVIANKGKRPVSERVAAQLAKEKQLGLDRPETYLKFKENCERFRSELVRLLENVRSKDKSVVGYAATSKSTTIINYCGITAGQIEYICDTTPIKQGKFSPGAHIPVKPYETFKDKYPDYALLFGYNHAKEIMAKETKFSEAGGKWIVYVPDVRVL